MWIQLGTESLTPRFCSIYFLRSKEDRDYECLVPYYEFPVLGARWHRFNFETRHGKYWKVLFEETSGEDDALAVRQVRFVRSPEVSATIVTQPECHILTSGPNVGQRQSVRLSVQAFGWPFPSYQWYVNDRVIPGETRPHIDLTITCAPDKMTRPFRCMKCKMTNRKVPYNAFYVICSNCKKTFNYKEIEPFNSNIAFLKERESVLKRKLLAQTQLYSQMKNSTDPDIVQQLVVIKAEIDSYKNQLVEHLKDRVKLKLVLPGVNNFSDEGVYTCKVWNIRAGPVKIVRITEPAVVVVEQSMPYKLRVVPSYLPRPQVIRKNWTVYSCILGTFTKGELEGLVTIFYYDKAKYEGPYVDEIWLDTRGRVNPAGRTAAHYGVYTCADGRVFEGNLVDNHFDPKNVQSYYRLTNCDGSVYEGSFCDEQYHGVGTYTYEDGSTYEGEWFKSKRFGYGHYRYFGKPVTTVFLPGIKEPQVQPAKQKFTYEGWWNNDLMHGEGHYPTYSLTDSLTDA